MFLLKHITQLRVLNSKKIKIKKLQLFNQWEKLVDQEMLGQHIKPIFFAYWASQEKLEVELLRAKIENYARMVSQRSTQVVGLGCMFRKNQSRSELGLARLVLGSYFKQNDLPFEGFWAFLLFQLWALFESFLSFFLGQ